MFTKSRPRLRLLLLVLACILSTSGCKTLSTTPVVKPTPPEVRCKQPAGPDVKALPRSDQWVEWLPSLEGPGVARLSEKAAAWIADTLGVVRQEKGLRKVEHDCLDALDKKGLITQ